MSNNQRNKESMPKRVFDAVGALNKAVVQRDDKVSRIEQDYPGEKLKTDDYNSRKQRLEVVSQEFEKAWISALKNLDELCRRVRQRQPHLNELTVENINSGNHFPDALAFGRMHLSYQNWKGYVPRLVPFPFKN